MEIAHRERFYTYSSVNRKSQLRREGAVISIGHWKHVPKSGVTKAGCAEGEVDAVDLAIALVLEEVDTSALSSVGAQLLAPWGLLFGRQRDGGSA
ncbi:hypothetical protein [Streptomyces sp. NBC_00344]|uniref:hypothetical protein n=1 Tax=Streptomyces sp. NBC_00344 TaxID=2975720 RepID=UPI002E1B8C74